MRAKPETEQVVTASCLPHRGLYTTAAPRAKNPMAARTARAQTRPAGPPAASLTDQADAVLAIFAVAALQATYWPPLGSAYFFSEFGPKTPRSHTPPVRLCPGRREGLDQGS